MGNYRISFTSTHHQRKYIHVVTCSVCVYVSVCLSVCDTCGISRENDSFANKFKKSTHDNKACKSLILSVLSLYRMSNFAM